MNGRTALRPRCPAHPGPAVSCPPARTALRVTSPLHSSLSPLEPKTHSLIGLTKIFIQVFCQISSTNMRCEQRTTTRRPAKAGSLHVRCAHAIRNFDLHMAIARQDSLFEVLQLIYKKSLQAFDSTECLHCFLTYAATLDNIRTQFKDTVNAYNEELLMTVPGAVPDFDAMNPFEELYCKTKAALRRLQSKNTVLDCNHIQNNYKTALQSLAVVSSTPILQSSTQSDALCSPQSFVINDDLPQKSIPLSP
ncbi:hypothetical protein K1T71_006048 [Dendrolimus kikuchii]|uniref:Uncharacterized protein n=1 Tax=Dendrolimus kikuchii TaxID=765133 RepID=A0ACC1D326_9NEOP|nr:hypothetical protein K1T71_006048 [Dendrolimus kikuchii]